jgi:hypothetical protein
MPDENQTEESEEKKTSRLTISLLLVAAAVLSVMFLIVLITVLFPQIFLAFVIMFEGSPPDHHMTCDEFGSVEMQKSWLKSDNITSYKDIPENEKRSLSNESREQLRELASKWYDETYYSNYSEMSEKEKDLFGSALDDRISLSSREYERYENDFTASLILYRQKIYECDIHTYRGA